MRHPQRCETWVVLIKSEMFLFSIMFRLSPIPSEPPVQPRPGRNKNEVACSPTCSTEIYLHLLALLDGAGTTQDLSSEDYFLAVIIFY
jgi:hypothetical protein